MTLQKFEILIDKIILGFLMLLVVGTPLLFTSYTRSVFEVNKLLLLRLCSIAIIGVWIFYTLIKKDQVQEEKPADSWTILGFTWKKIGLEIPTLVWLGFNLLSTIFAQNHIVAIIGAYDRWEGIVTIVNYAFLWYFFAKWVRKAFQVTWLLFGILISTTLSAIYGVCQSFGLDYMNWSINASARVFACINNPVHFCAYVAMVGTIMLGWLLTLSERPQSAFYKILKPSIFVCLLIIFYAQFLSFSRATWLGFCLAITLFYLIAFKILKFDSKKSFFIDCGATTGVIASLYLLNIFKVYLNSKSLTLVLLSIILGYLAFQARQYQLSKSELFKFVAAILCLSIGFLFDFPSLPFYADNLVRLVFAASFLGLCYRLDPNSNLNILFARVAILVMFTKLQFVSGSLVSGFILYSMLVGGLYLLTKRQNFNGFHPETRNWLLATAFCYALVISAPAIVERIHLVFSPHSSETGIQAVENAQRKATAYQVSFAGHSARYSMWKSAVPWIREYWLLGSGPDSIKYMYPDYRRPDYGILEGGHNFTPDKLHNEYINTLATRGVLASLVYYVWLILGWFALVLAGYRRMQNHPDRFILLGLISAATVYLGQVLFNFGVVATLVLFYIFVGMAHGIVANRQEESQNG